MEFWKTVFDLARRKLVGPPILALAVVAGVVGFLIVPAHYTANVVLLLTGPGNTQPAPGEPLSKAGRTNPLLVDSTGLRTTAATLILSVGTPEVLAQLGAPKDGPNKLVIDDGGSNQALFGSGGPFLSITADSPSEQTAKELVVRAQKRVEDDLAAKQKELGAPAILYISLVNVTPPSTPEAQLGGKVQTAGIAAVLTLFAGFAAAYAWTLRQARRRVAAGPSTEAWTEAVDAVEPRPVLELAPKADEAPAPEPQPKEEDAQAGKPKAVDEDSADTQTFPIVK